MSGGAPAHVELRRAVATQQAYPSDDFDGRGIVMCVGGSRLFTCAWVGLGVLRRRLGCTLPVEVWHLGPEELGPVEADLLADLDVTAVDALDGARGERPRVLGGWELKAHALVHSRFREVLMLDADNVPVRDPAFLFDSPDYLDTGAVFWPDVVRIGPGSPIWDLCGVPYRSEPSWESGQVVVDKSRCWQALRVALCMNEHSDVFYTHLHGDKDTYHLAWRMLDQPCAMPRRPVVMPWGLLHYDLAGEPLFQHRNLAKWVLRGDNLLDPAFRHQDACLELLADLESRWSGRIELLPARSSADLEVEAGLAAIRLFRFERLGSDSATLELLPGNRIGEGRGSGPQRWYVVDGSLVFDDWRASICTLEAGEDGVWRGQAVLANQEIELRPLAAVAQDPVGGVVASILTGVDDGAVTVGDAAAALVTIGRVLDLGEVLTRERTRWSDDTPGAEAIDRARRRLGGRDPSLRPLQASVRRHYEPG